MTALVYSFILTICFSSLAYCQLTSVKSLRDVVQKIQLSDTNFSSYILPTNLKPTWYNLTLLPFLNNSTFKGKVFVKFDVFIPTNVIVLNARFESIQANSIKADLMVKNQNISISNTTIDEDHQMVWFFLNDTLTVQRGVDISIYYDGLLATDMMGFYLSTYNTSDSSGIITEHRMAITQFESTFARRAFPCFDEPLYRANFTINIYRSPDQVSLSNMPRIFSINDTSLGMILDVYETTPEMPTYLVAFGVCDLANISDGGKVHVFTRPKVLHDGDYALSIAQPVLDTIGNFVSIQYPLTKIDIVTVPDFDAGAMENWGLTTYREKYVLYNQQKNTWLNKFGVLSVIAHEFGHQWFGDLVTPHWWNYTWLNEAFATYFEFTVPNQMYRDWNIGSSMYVVSALQYALALDIDDTRPMTYPVYTPDQIENIFDYVIYEKGGSVLRMMENFVTTPVWKDGLHRYLMANAYKTGTPDELFTQLEQAANDSKIPLAQWVEETFRSWTTQPGYPLITVHKINDNMTYITQKPYELTNSSELRWVVPLTYTTQLDQQFDASKASKMILHVSSETLSMNNSGWVIFNTDQVGYYRVTYDEENWSKLTDQLSSNFSVIGTINRAQLLDDAFHLAKSGHLNYSIAFGLTSYLPHENGFAPWNAFFVNMRFLINQFYNTSVGEDLMKYTHRIMSSPFQTLTANLTNTVSTFLGSLTLEAAARFTCDIGLPECEIMATNAFDNYKTVVPEVRQAVICTTLRLDSSGKKLQTILDDFLNSDNGAEKLMLMNAMGCVSSSTAINMYLNVVCDVNANHFRLQDRWIAFRALVSHQTGITPTLQYLVNNYNKVSQALGKRISAVFSTLGNTISQVAHINQVRAILNDTSVNQDLRNKLNTSVLPPVLKRHMWAQSQQAEELKMWLKSHSSSASLIPVSSILMMVPVISIIFQL